MIDPKGNIHLSPAIITLDLYRWPSYLQRHSIFSNLIEGQFFIQRLHSSLRGNDRKKLPGFSIKWGYLKSILFYNSACQGFT